MVHAHALALSCLLQLLLSFVERESILRVHGKDDSTQQGVEGLNVSSHFPRFQESAFAPAFLLPSFKCLPLPSS